MTISLGERIKRWREDRDLTQATLADRLDISPSAVAQWELDQTVPTTGNVAKVAEAVGVSLEEFWGSPPAKKRRRAS